MVIHEAEQFNRDRMREIVRIQDDRNAEIERKRRESLGLVSQQIEAAASQTPTGAKTMAATKTTPKTKTYGEHSATAVVRWMGAKGWTFTQAQAVVKKLRLGLADVTIRIQLNAGASGKRGEPASLSRDEQKALRDAAKATKKD